MNPLSVVIPSRTVSNLIPCVRAIKAHEPEAFVYVVDDLQDGSIEEACERLWVSDMRGEKPFVYARNCNLAITTAEALEGSSDVILLNDDAILETPGGFTAMQKAAEKHPEYGIISSTTNVAGNVDQYRRTRNDEQALRDAGAKCVAFVCVLIPRRTLNTVGLLDERFTAYGWEDNDYCRRVRQAGLKVGIFDGCFVDHARLKSSYRGAANAAGDIGAGREIYRAKWGDLN